MLVAISFSIHIYLEKTGEFLMSNHQPQCACLRFITIVKTLEISSKSFAIIGV